MVVRNRGMQEALSSASAFCPGTHNRLQPKLSCPAGTSALSLETGRSHASSVLHVARSGWTPCATSRRSSVRPASTPYVQHSTCRVAGSVSTVQQARLQRQSSSAPAACQRSPRQQPPHWHGSSLPTSSIEDAPPQQLLPPTLTPLPTLSMALCVHTEGCTPRCCMWRSSSRASAAWRP